ncbi:MAG: TonB-dependent receptor [Bacteroidota bacterium]
MKMYKLQTDLFLKSLLGKIAFSGKIAGLLIIFNLAAATFVFAGANRNHGLTKGQQLLVPVTGRVIDDNNNPLSGVTVQVKNSNVTTTTDANGNFSITVPDKKSVLVFTYVGFEKLELVNSNNLVVHLKVTNGSLGEVVVVGYGTQKRISVTGAVDRVSSALIEDRPVANITQALQGTSPGLVIQQRTFQPVSGALNINIRGLGTTNNNDPLVVIDGIIGGDLNLINPNDIDNVSILKDAGSAAIYGSRSANGVILITTKKGKKNSKPTISYSGSYGIQTPRYTFKQVHGWENAMYKNISLANSGKPAQYTDADIAAFKQQGDGDWRLETIIQHAPQQAHNITVSGGSANSTYLLSAGYFDQSNMLIGPGYGAKRYNVRLNQSTTYNKFTLTSIFSYVKGVYKEPSAGTEGLVGDATRSPLIYSFNNAQGNYVINPVVNSNSKAILEKGGYTRSNNDEIRGNFTGEYVFTPAFKVRAVLGGTLVANTQFQRQINLVYANGGSYGGDRQVYDRNTKSLFTNTQLIAEYNKTFSKKHDLNILIGATNESFKSEGNGAQKRGTDSLLGIPTTGTILSTGTTDGTYNSNTNTSETSLNSLLGRVGYSYESKYFIEGNFRYDGSSNFKSGRRWGFFPSIGAKWRLTEERFLDNYRAKVGDLMIRGTYGLLGSQGVNPYQYITSYSTNGNAYGYGGSGVSGATINLANPSLSWEKAASYNLGLDATFLQRKLNFTFEYYHKITSDILQNREDVPALFGQGLPTFNVSKQMSKGWEATLSYDLKGRSLSQSFAFNIADNQNELRELSGSVQEYEFKREEFWFVRRVGLPITVYRGYRTNGLYQTADELIKYPKIAGLSPGLGDLKYVDQNGDGIIDSKDRVILGNPFPRYTFGFTYNVAYKGFDMSLLIQGVGKRDALIRGELLEAYHYGYSGTLYEHQKDFWTPTNTGAKYPRIAENGSASNSNNYKIGSDIYLFNAAYARLKNISLGYSLPASLLAKIHMQKVRLYINAQNLLTVSKQKIIDPEQSEFNNRVDINSGANSARSYPTPVYYGFGLDISF